jgi:L-ribulokinase
VASPGTAVGKGLHRDVAKEWGLDEGTPVSVCTIDAHVQVPGVGVGAEGVLVVVMGTSGCYMINHKETSGTSGKSETGGTVVPGCLGSVVDGITPGYVGMEMGQASMGDLFAWLSALTNRSPAELEVLAKEEMDHRKRQREGHSKDTSEGANKGASKGAHRRRYPLALDWFNGCRSPFNDGGVRGALVGLDLSTTPGQLYLALAEGLACGARQSKHNFMANGVPVRAVCRIHTCWDCCTHHFQYRQH